jgi:hypothetical protein
MTENIEKFLQTAYTDEKLAALLAHAQDGKLSHGSCCCLAGIPTATHPLHRRDEFDYEGDHQSQGFTEISWEFGALGRIPGKTESRETQDARRCERIIPLIYAEMERRRIERLPDISLAEQREREEEAAAEEGALIEASGYNDPVFDRR